MKKSFRPAHILFMASIFFAACSSPSTESTAKESTDSVLAQKEPAKTALAFKDAGLSKAWPNYDKLREALIKGDNAAAQAAAGFLAGALIDVKGSEAAAKQARDIASASDLEGQRKVFALLNESFIGLVKKTGINGGELYVQNCPMYAKGKGANWLSAQKEIKNPYYGDMMLECGSVKETIK